jgi:hypothetical protein
MEESPQYIQSIDPAALSAIAEQALRAPVIKLSDWTASPLSHAKVLETTGGLYRFDGHAWDGEQSKPWSAVLKIINRPEYGCLEPKELCYWKRELLAYQTGLLAVLPTGLRAPRCFGVSEHEQDAWIWLENVKETGPVTWTLAEFQRAARSLGSFSGAYLTGTPLPVNAWLCPSIFRAILGDDEWWAKFINPQSADNAWQRPFVQQAFPEPLRSRILQLWADKWAFITANERLPQVLCHNDAHRRNLFLDEQDELVAIDWAFCGPGGLGNDLGELIGTSLTYFELEPAHAVELESVVTEAYTSGLREAGWSGDEQFVRLGYTISLALWWGATLPCAAATQLGGPSLNIEAKYGRPVESVLQGWKLLAEFFLDRADQARFLMKKLA